MKKMLGVLTVVAAGAAFAFATSAEASGQLKVGEYSCSQRKQQTPLMGMAFKVVDGRHYTDLDNSTSGTYEIRGDNVYFHGGHLDGQVGDGLEGDTFYFSSIDVQCGPW